MVIVHLNNYYLFSLVSGANWRRPTQNDTELSPKNV